MSRVNLPVDWLLWAYSPYDIARFLLTQEVRRTDLSGHTRETLAQRWNLQALLVGLDTLEDRVYYTVWKDVVHSLMAVFSDYERAHVVERTMLERTRDAG